MAVFFAFIVFLLTAPVSEAARYPAYDIGTPTLTHYYVNPVTGSDSNAGTTRDSALRSLARAWQLMPNSRVAATGGMCKHLKDIRAKF